MVDQQQGQLGSSSRRSLSSRGTWDTSSGGSGSRPSTPGRAASRGGAAAGGDGTAAAAQGTVEGQLGELRARLAALESHVARALEENHTVHTHNAAVGARNGCRG